MSLPKMPFWKIAPRTELPTYAANESLIFDIPGDAGTAISANSFAFSFDEAIYQDLANGVLVQDKEIYLDPTLGSHAHFASMSVQINGQSQTVETFLYYPVEVGNVMLATSQPLSLGTETDNCVAGHCPNRIVSIGYAQGSDIGVPWVSKVVKPINCLNKTLGQPICFSKTGTITLTINLGSDAQALCGKDVTTASGRLLRNFYIWYRPMPTTPELEAAPLTFVTMTGVHGEMTSQNATLISTAEGLATGMHASFIRVATENTLGRPYYSHETLDGVPAEAQDANGNLVLQTFPNYGASRVTFAVSNQETSLFNFELTSREEIAINWLRAFGQDPKDYCATLQKTMNGQGYGIGVAFGAPIQLSGRNFSLTVQSGITERYSYYIFFPVLRTLK